MKCTGETLIRHSSPYEVPRGNPIDITIDIGLKRISVLRERYPHLSLTECEYIITGLAFANALLDFDGFCLHSSAVALNNQAFLFSAPSGTGKSTHTSLWQSYFGPEKALIINDDKPALRLIGDKFYVYGTPWSGKSNLSLNRKVTLNAIVFIEQARENYLKRLNNKDAVPLLYYQSLCPNPERNKISKLLCVLDTLLKQIPLYQMGCTISTGAVEMVYHEICSLN